ncbi:BlaI/MecI/CopY family transcriptional regulator [Metasolibacillus meyeri]|uniref:BlaI/MecI/CopY family transcriptional regulator n=1 Tax=Metasolibacillus meyeri TaxID=1071052 RepID=A0AAW9NUV5_9BACL|nr:BlaI/MecI/CopY family transcriptional regulator [Metasolibacillus meyeri]MEC1178951.1 BlaI/MecI/CopY family transcriptional regulator [Metasolibacillus meyeri]
MKRLPETEFEIMKVVWASNPPVTTAMIMGAIGEEKGWKIQTVVSLMQRLIERGFLRSEKEGKERFYYPIVKKDDYLNFETAHFMKLYHKNSVMNLVNTLYKSDNISDEELDSLLQWVKEREE